MLIWWYLEHWLVDTWQNKQTIIFWKIVCSVCSLSELCAEIRRMAWPDRPQRRSTSRDPVGQDAEQRPVGKLHSSQMGQQQAGQLWRWACPGVAGSPEPGSSRGKVLLFQSCADWWGGWTHFEFVIDLCKMLFFGVFFAILRMRISSLLLTAEVLCQ